MEWLALVYGLVIGSFLNVCIYRWPRDLSVIRPARSFCPACEASIAWYDNIPLVSYLLLRARCRACAAPISWRYPLVEALTAALFFGFTAWLGPSLAALKYCVFSAIVVGLLFADLEERILPDELTKGGTVAGFLFALVQPVPLLLPVDLYGWRASLTAAALGAFLPAGFLWFSGWVYEKVRKREGLGFGDVKMMMMAGSFLGLHGTLITMVIGSLLGSVIGLAYIKLTGKDAASYELPFGTFLAIGAIPAAVWVESLMR